MAATIRTKATLPNAEEVVLCAKCTGRTAHIVLASVHLEGWETVDSNNTFSWDETHQTIQCLGCKTISFRQRTSNSEAYEHDENGNMVSEVTESLYPPRREGVTGLGNDKYVLPPIVKRIYDETLIALSNAQPVLAGIGLRALLDAVCKEKNAVGGTLHMQIDNLVSQAVLTPTSAAFLHKIRSLGNAAAHEAMPHTDSQLSLAMSVIEHLLQDVFILPQKMEAEFK